jgi:hypothetical protein
MSIRETIETFEGTDTELIAALNDPKNKTVVNDGLVSLPMVAAVSEQLAGALVVTLKRTIATLEYQVDSLDDGSTAKDQTEGSLEVIRSFYVRLTESSYGAPIDSDSFRAQFTGIATQGGWDVASIEAFLSLGAVYTSDAVDEFGRDATQADIDGVRRAIFNESQVSRAVNAAALFSSRLEQSETAWTDQEAIDQWALAWVEHESGLV